MYRTYLVIDKDNCYVDVVNASIETDPNTGAEAVTVCYREMQAGERLVETSADWHHPSQPPYAGMPGLIKACWDGSAWVEGATDEEITAWELAHPAPEPPPMTMTESLLDTVSELDYRLSLHQLGIEEV